MHSGLQIAFGLPGYQEMLVILVLGLLIFGRRLPEVGRQIGKSVVQLRRALQDFKDQIESDESFREARGAVHDIRRAAELPRTVANPRRVLENLTEETLSSPGPETTAVAAPEPSPIEREAASGEPERNPAAEQEPGTAAGAEP